MVQSGTPECYAASHRLADDAALRPDWAAREDSPLVARLLGQVRSLGCQAPTVRRRPMDVPLGRLLRLRVHRMAVVEH